MNKNWLEKLEERMPPRIEQAVKNADKAIQDFTLQLICHIGIRFQRHHATKNSSCASYKSGKLHLLNFHACKRMPVSGLMLI